MRKSRRLTLGAAATAIFLALPISAQAADDYDADPLWTGQKPFYTEQTLAMGGDGLFPNYRIPALTVTNEGTVLAS